jgi:hypothetical protein
MLDTLNVDRYETMAIESFVPRPESVLQEVINLPNSTAQFAFIHGSYVYRKESGSIACATYCDTRVYRGECFVESRLSILHQKPDMDAIVIVGDLNEFALAFESYARENYLARRLGYFFTLNAMTEQTAFTEIVTPSPTAVKRILAFRPKILIGQNIVFDTLEAEAKRQISSIDSQFQIEYDTRKDLFRQQATAGVEEFTITRDEYRRDFPLLLESFEGTLHGNFPRDRIKIVLPYPMGIKKSLDLNNPDKALDLI